MINKLFKVVYMTYLHVLQFSEVFIQILHRERTGTIKPLSLNTEITPAADECFTN